MNARWTWTAGLVVALAAAVATAHGSFEVARAAGAPTPVAALYPAMSDGLALVAYAATTRLRIGGRRYAWTVVVVAAGLSGLAQAVWLAGGLGDPPVALRLGVGAWPAAAAAVAAHLLFMLGVAPEAEGSHAVQPVVQSNSTLNHAPDRQSIDDDPTLPPPAETPGERARAAAHAHLERYQALPTVTQVVDAAGVARGTAAAALKDLRRTHAEGSNR